MEIMEKSLLSKIQQISKGIDQLNVKLESKEKEILNLQEEIEELKSNHDKALDQIKIYIQELEQIKERHALSNNHAE